MIKIDFHADFQIKSEIFEQKLRKSLFNDQILRSI